MAWEGSRAQYYRDRAKQIREKAETCRDREIKEDLEMVASQFEWLAEQGKRGIVGV